jgi:5-formyltetrahydrofolate cyclo-ligase
MPDSIAEAKATLRSALRSRRRAFAGGAAAHDALVARVLANISGARSVAGYVAVGAEVDPAPILLALAAAGAQLALPRIGAREEPMRFLRWMPGDPLEPGPLGVIQPRADAPALVPALILAPLLGFDRACHRIGQGAGFYDRAFAQHPGARRIGLAWSVQEVDALPLDPWDAPLDAVATEKEWIA